MSQIKGFFSPVLEKIRLKKVAKYINKDKKATSNILDLGCGDGRVLDFINPLYTYIGIDSDQENIWYAKHKHKENNFICSDIETLELADNVPKFDYIIMAAILEHLNDWKILLKLKDALAENGKIIITTPTPFANKVHKIGAKIKIFDNDAHDEHKMLFDKKSLLALAKKIGLYVHKYETFEFGLNNFVVMEK